MAKDKIKQVWKINIYFSHRQKVTLTATYTLKLTVEATPAKMNRKIRKDFKSELQNKNNFFDFQRVK